MKKIFVALTLFILMSAQFAWAESSGYTHEQKKFNEEKRKIEHAHTIMRLVHPPLKGVIASLEARGERIVRLKWKKGETFSPAHFEAKTCQTDLTEREYYIYEDGRIRNLPDETERFEEDCAFALKVLDAMPKTTK